ncbi:AraC family transcriptional regulator [Niabella soli]|uniref:Transcriptional regulator n=1 Tax=Niabella soli DSM 19437 TaxID=929713 RepID=W0F4G9_9BACT|nr:AraC family transcriptional regulator [Niabella soli]AHF16216.1 transcriptional regulator [Niabella soli DSM 19437]
MILPEVYREKSPLSDKDCFVVFDRRKTSFTFPVHVHPEYEINFVSGATGAQRVIGDSVETIGDKDLVFIANPELKHAWMDGQCKLTNIHEITIQFHPQLIEQNLNKNQFQSLKRLFKSAARGLCFGPSAIEKIQPLLQVITMENDGFYSVMRLFILLYELSKSTDCRELASGEPPEVSRNVELLNRLHEYVTGHITETIRIDDIAAALNMSRSTFARFLNAQTKMSFTDYLLDCRVKTAILLLKTGASIQSVSNQCGFNSVSYFYRVFKKANGINPAEYRDNYKKQKLVI